MKKLPFSLIAVVLLLPSCAICESDPEPSPSQSHLVGTYKMTAWNAPVQVDLDQNGTSSRNLMQESGCYAPSQLTLSANHTYDLSYHFLDVDGESSGCSIEISHGAWYANGDNLRLTASDGEETLYSYGNVNQILTRSETNWQYPVNEDGEMSYQNGAVNMVFAKEP